MNLCDILFVSDLDGTLLRPDVTLDPKDAAQLNALAEAGVRITYATARTIRSVSHILSDLHFAPDSPPVALMNGVLIRDMARGIYLDIAAMSPETSAMLLRAMSDAGASPFIYALNDAGELFTYYHSLPNDAMRTFMDDRIRLYQKPFQQIETTDDIRETVIYCCLLGSEQDILRAEAAIQGIPKIRFTSYRDNYDPSVFYLEIFDERADKRHAVEALRTVTSAKTVVCFGDNLNDIPMFEASDIRVAVSGAHPELKTRADAIAHDGVTAWIVQYLKDNALL